MFTHKSAVVGDDFQPIMVGVFDKIDAHLRVFETDAAHFLMFLVEGFKIIHAKGEMEFIISQIIGFFAVLEIRQFQFMARLTICQVNKYEARRFKAALFRKPQGLLVKSKDLIKINDWLLPLSWIYGGMVRFRNWLFDIGLKKSQSFSIPIISVGNITVGGSGKTPHVEYLIRLLHDKVKIAVLSRGYKRKTSGYVLADKDTTMSEIGDEPFQMHSKFDDIYVAVDAKRVRGIEKLQNEEPTKDVDVVLLDDAYQHRFL